MWQEGKQKDRNADGRCHQHRTQSEKEEKGEDGNQQQEKKEKESLKREGICVEEERWHVEEHEKEEKARLREHEKPEEKVRGRIGAFGRLARGFSEREWEREAGPEGQRRR